MKKDNTYTLVSKLNKAYVNEIESELKNRGYEKLVVSHGVIILKLLKDDEITMLELSKAIDKTPQTTTTLIKKLIELDFVNIYKDEKDKRITRVKILEKGEKLAQVILDISEKIYSKQYQGLTEQEIINFRNTLKKVEKNFR